MMRINITNEDFEAVKQGFFYYGKSYLLGAGMGAEIVINLSKKKYLKAGAMTLGAILIIYHEAMKSDDFSNAVLDARNSHEELKFIETDE